MRSTIFLCLVLLITSSCTDSNTYFVPPLDEGVEVFSLVGTLNDSSGQELQQFNFSTGRQDQGFDNIIYSGTQLTRAGNSLIVVMAEAGTYISQDVNAYAEIMRLQFWSDEFPDDGLPIIDVAEDFFLVGREFPFGVGVDSVNIGYRIDSPELVDIPSMSRFLDNAQGILRIVEVEHLEDVDLGRGVEQRHNGMKVTVTFSGEIGVYDHSVILASPGEDILDYRALEKALLEGTFTFFVETLE